MLVITEFSLFRGAIFIILNRFKITLDGSQHGVRIKDLFGLCCFFVWLGGNCLNNFILVVTEQLIGIIQVFRNEAFRGSTFLDHGARQSETLEMNPTVENLVKIKINCENMCEYHALR